MPLYFRQHIASILVSIALTSASLTTSVQAATAPPNDFLQRQLFVQTVPVGQPMGLPITVADLLAVMDRAVATWQGEDPNSPWLLTLRTNPDPLTKRSNTIAMLFDPTFQLYGYRPFDHPVAYMHRVMVNEIEYDDQQSYLVARDIINQAIHSKQKWQ